MTYAITAERGRPAALGATLEGDGVHFAVHSENAGAIQLCLFDPTGTRETARLVLPSEKDGRHYGF
ncbi:MAG: hypothetical protein ABJD38_20405, partial [Aurantimonas coralicida]